MIPEGKQRAVAVEWSFGQAKTGTHQIAVTFDLLDLPGQRITWYGSFTERAMERTVESLQYCGWSCGRLDKLTGMGTQEVQLVIEHEDDQQGNPRPRVRWVNRAAAAFKNEVQGDALSELADWVQQQMGDRLPAGAVDAPPPHTDADIPF